MGHQFNIYFSIVIPIFVSIITAVLTTILKDKLYLKFNQNQILAPKEIPEARCYDVRKKTQLDSLKLHNCIASYSIHQVMDENHIITAHFMQETFEFVEGMPLTTVIVIDNKTSKTARLIEMFWTQDVKDIDGMDCIEVLEGETVYFFCDAKEIPKEIKFLFGNSCVKYTYLLEEHNFSSKIEPLRSFGIFH